MITKEQVDAAMARYNLMQEAYKASMIILDNSYRDMSNAYREFIALSKQFNQERGDDAARPEAEE